MATWPAPPPCSWPSRSRRTRAKLAPALVEALQRQPAVQRWVAALEIAGPGFINLRLTTQPSRRSWPRCWRLATRSVVSRASGERVMVEFVSANPTGPLHVGHGRNAALGDSICTCSKRRAGE